MFIDTHCHLSKEYYESIDNVVEENLNAGVFKMIISGCDKEGILEAIDFIDKYNNVYATIGYHPDEVGNVSDDDLLYIKKLALNNKKIVGIGEIGLDYYHNKENRIDQINLFKKQLALAEELSLPVVIHSRDAVKDTIDCISSYNVKGVIHCFNGSLETANIYIKKGFKLGIGGVITFKHCKLGDVVENIALENIVLETDSPYLTPEPYRGKVNSSKYIPIIANKIASLHSCDVKLVEKITTNNVFDIFNL